MNHILNQCAGDEELNKKGQSVNTNTNKYIHTLKLNKLSGNEPTTVLMLFVGECLPYPYFKICLSIRENFFHVLTQRIQSGESIFNQWFSNWSVSGNSGDISVSETKRMVASCSYVKEWDGMECHIINRITLHNSSLTLNVNNTEGINRISNADLPVDLRLWDSERLK